MIFTCLLWVKLRSPRSREWLTASLESGGSRGELGQQISWGGGSGYTGSGDTCAQCPGSGDWWPPLLTSAQSSPRSYPRAQVSCPLEATEIVTRKVTQESCMTMASLQNAVCEFFDIRENVSKSTTKQFKVFKVIKRYHLVCLCLHGMHLDHIS